MKLSTKRSIRIKKSKKQSRKHDKKGKYKVKRTRITMRRRALDLKNKSLKRKKMKGGTKTTKRSGISSKTMTTKKGSSKSPPHKFHTRPGTLKKRPAPKVRGGTGSTGTSATPASPRAEAFLARQKQKEAKEAKEAKAATKIQSLVRGRQVREKKQKRLEVRWILMHTTERTITRR